MFNNGWYGEWATRIMLDLKPKKRSKRFWIFSRHSEFLNMFYFNFALSKNVNNFFNTLWFEKSLQFLVKKPKIEEDFPIIYNIISV